MKGRVKVYIVRLPENMIKWVALYEWASRIFEMQSNPKSPPVESCLPAPEILLLRNFVTIPWNIVCYKWIPLINAQVTIETKYFEAKFSKQPLKMGGGGAVLCSLQYLISHLFWSNFWLFFSFSIFPPFSGDHCSIKWANALISEVLIFLNFTQI